MNSKSYNLIGTFDFKHAEYIKPANLMEEKYKIWNVLAIAGKVKKKITTPQAICRRTDIPPTME